MTLKKNLLNLSLALSVALSCTIVSAASNGEAGTSVSTDVRGYSYCGTESSATCEDLDYREAWKLAEHLATNELRKYAEENCKSGKIHEPITFTKFSLFYCDQERRADHSLYAVCKVHADSTCE